MSFPKNKMPSQQILHDLMRGFAAKVYLTHELTSELQIVRPVQGSNIEELWDIQHPAVIHKLCLLCLRWGTLLCDCHPGLTHLWNLAIAMSMICERGSCHMHACRHAVKAAWVSHFETHMRRHTRKTRFANCKCTCVTCPSLCGSLS